MSNCASFFIVIALKVDGMRRFSIGIGVLCCFLWVVFTSCQEQNSVGFNDRLASDIAQIDNYLSAHNIKAQADPSGLRYVLGVQDLPASVVVPKLTDSISVVYTGKLLPSEEIFATTGVDTTKFKLSTLIPAWQIALKQIYTGTTIDLYVPSGLGYGAVAHDNIPANSNLIFHIHLLK